MLVPPAHCLIDPSAFPPALPRNMITSKFHIQKRMIQAIRDPGFKLSLLPGGEANNRVLLRPAISQHESKDLEFIGDSAIGLSATMALHKKYPKRLSPFAFDVSCSTLQILSRIIPT